MLNHQALGELPGLGVLGLWILDVEENEWRIWGRFGGGSGYDEILKDVDYAKVKWQRSQTPASISRTTSELQPTIRNSSDS